MWRHACFKIIQDTNLGASFVITGRKWIMQTTSNSKISQIDTLETFTVAMADWDHATWLWQEKKGCGLGVSVTSCWLKTYKIWWEEKVLWKAENWWKEWINSYCWWFTNLNHLPLFTRFYYTLLRISELSTPWSFRSLLLRNSASTRQGNAKVDRVSAKVPQKAMIQCSFFGQNFSRI